MVCRNLALMLAVLLQIVSQVVASSASYVSLKSGNYENVGDLISQASDDDRLAIFRFTEYPIVEAWKLREEHAPYLTTLLQSAETYQEQFSFDRMSRNDKIEVFSLNDLEFTASELLYNYDLEGKSVILFNFESSRYDLGSVDEFMESAYIFLSDSFDGVVNVVLNVGQSADSHHSIETDLKAERAKVEHKKEKTVDEDNDVLSTVWTEGLIMCLIVSFLLLAILVVAISWMSSMDISYGALEKSTNPLKKTK